MMELEADKFIKDCKVTKEDWQTYLDRGTLEHIVANMLITYSQDQVKKLNIVDVSGSASDFYTDLMKLINSYCKEGLSKPDLVAKMEYATDSCKMS